MARTAAKKAAKTAKKRKYTKRASAPIQKTKDMYAFAERVGDGTFRIVSGQFTKEETELEVGVSSIEHGMVLLKLVPVSEVVKEPYLKSVNE